MAQVPAVFSGFGPGAGNPMAMKLQEMIRQAQGGLGGAPAMPPELPPDHTMTGAGVPGAAGASGSMPDGSGPMDQNVMKLLNRYWPNRQGRSQLEMLAMGGSQTTPLRQASGIPNLMSYNMPPFTPQNVASGAAPVGLPPAVAPGAAAGAAGSTTDMNPREAAGRSLMNWINSESQRIGNPLPTQTDWQLFAPLEAQFDKNLAQARAAGF